MNKLIPVILLLTVFSLTPAFAHELIAVRPDNTMYQKAVFFPNPSTESYFTLEEFEVQGQSHWYAFNGLQGQEVFIQTLVPNAVHMRNFTPCFDLLIGGEKVTPKPQKTLYIEEFSQTSWFITCELKMELPSDGFYYIRAHDELNHYNVGDVGKFSLGFGEAEDFTIFDWIKVPFWLLHINLFFENLVFVWLMLVLLVIISVMILYYLWKRRE